ncbi:hypothetical protein LXL04_023909 [Taraxacum kok-saghyz]
MELHDEEWELVNDDGFVYRRLKRLRLDPTVSTSSATPPPDTAAEERNRKERKKSILLKLKARYQQEIQQWEHLSNTLKALQDRTPTQPPPTALPHPPVSQLVDHSMNCSYHELAETLLIQVEAQEASINEFSTLCDVAEVLCSAHEQLLKQPFVSLPIWESSPRKLITSLCNK